MMTTTPQRYSTVAIALHWITAALMIYMLLLGEVHAIGSKLGIGLLIVHVAAALKHQFSDQMKLLQRMKPF